MANYRAGDVIRLTRNAVGMTQEQLSEGICSVETLSRIENGKHKVKQSTYAQLMEKMERDPRRSYAVCTGKDMELLEERIWVEDAMAKHDYEKADSYLRRLKRKIADDKLSRQYIERIEGVIDYRLKRITAQRYVKKMKEVIQITVSNYEVYLHIETKEQAYPFTEQEVMVLNSLANGYGDIDQPQESIRIFDALLLCLEEGYMDPDSVAKLKMLIERNYVMALEEYGMYQKALEKASKLLTLVIENDYGRMIPVVLVEISWNMRKICKDNNGNMNNILPDIKKRLRQAYYIAAARNDYVNLKIIENFYFKCFDEKV